MRSPSVPAAKGDPKRAQQGPLMAMMGSKSPGDFSGHGSPHGDPKPLLTNPEEGKGGASCGDLQATPKRICKPANVLWKHVHPLGVHPDDSIH